MMPSMAATLDRPRPAIPEAVLACGVVAIGRRLRPDVAVRVADALLAGGVRAFELTLNEPEADALEAIAAIAGRAGAGGLVIGAGTVLSTDAARRALDAGARFLVMPHTDGALVAWAADRGVPTFPGAFTPTEILAAWRAGASAVKLFPASVAGPGFLRELRGPLPEDHHRAHGRRHHRGRAHFHRGRCRGRGHGRTAHR